MQIYFHSRLCSYLPRVPILVEGTVYIYIYIYIYSGFAFFFISKNHCVETTLNESTSSSVPFIVPVIE